jgi:hypothetical protein
VWSTKPISESWTKDSSKRNWWAAKPLALSPQPLGDGRVAAMIPCPEKGAAPRAYFALFSFDAASNMSGMSNLAGLDRPSAKEQRNVGFSPEPPPTPQARCIRATVPGHRG